LIALTALLHIRSLIFRCFSANRDEQKVKTDPNVAPLPPHLPLEQAKAFMSAMVKGDRSSVAVVADTARQIIGGLRERL
jgi:pyruvate dehydrogenase (quinone)